MAFDPEVVSASERIVEAIKEGVDQPPEEQKPLPEDALAVFNAALEEGERLDNGLVGLGRTHGPMALPILICELELDDLRSIVLHHVFKCLFTVRQETEKQEPRDLASRIIDHISELADQIALQDEHSHVDRSVRERVREIVVQREDEELLDTAQRVVQGLRAAELGTLVADWLDAQRAI